MSTETNGPGRFEHWTERACDQIDAGFFSGDTFHYPESIERIEWYLGRWSRELARIKQREAEETIEQGKTEPAGDLTDDDKAMIVEALNRLANAADNMAAALAQGAYPIRREPTAQELNIGIAHCQAKADRCREVAAKFRKV
jgi:hypothetical protein